MPRKKQQEWDLPSLEESSSSSSQSSSAPLSTVKICKNCKYSSLIGNAEWLRQCNVVLPPFFSIARQRIVNVDAICDLHQPKE
jgi:hypothetical protein